MWENIITEESDVIIQIDVTPLEDEFPHILGEDCKCKPTLSFEPEEEFSMLLKIATPMYTHNAYDNREALEIAKRVMDD